MALEELRNKVLYQNSIEIWIGASKEKNIDWFDTENYKKFIAFLLKNNLNMKQMPICFDESDKASEGGHSKKVFANKLAAFNDKNSSCYSIKLNDSAIELIRKFNLQFYYLFNFGFIITSSAFPMNTKASPVIAIIIPGGIIHHHNPLADAPYTLASCKI